LIEKRDSSRLEECLPTKKPIPLPTGDTAYAKAKRAEYLERDLDKAEGLYRKAIFLGERAPSAAKDLAGVLHQKGKTEEACQFLRRHQHLFSLEPKKYQNLLSSLQR
jgi:Flp pilus assembly protein TadD